MPYKEMPRECEVIFAGIGKNGDDLLTVVDCDDGAYDLDGVTGTPEEIGKAVEQSLRHSDLITGKRTIVEDGGELFLTLKIRFKNKPAAKFPCKHCGGEIGWDAPSGVCSEECLRAAQGLSK
jgi:hypothetical protein